jgi:quinol monooxygenase YgiN
MFTVIVDITVKKDCVDQFREVIIRQGENSLAKEDGCLGFDILQDPADPTRFTLYESYIDEPTFYEIHRHTPHFKVYAESTAPWVESKSSRVLTRIWPEV